jgi:integrase/recombinase XerD
MITKIVTVGGCYIMQAAGEHLLTQVKQSLSGICLGVDVSELHSRLSEIISCYDIKRIDIEQTHPDLQEKIDLFLSGKQLEGLSKVTLSGYKLHLRIFADIVKKKVEDINTADIRIYLSRFKEQKITTMSTKLSVLKSFFGWLTSEEILPRDPTAKIKPPKKERRLPKALSIEELEMLREACQNTRQRTLIEVLYATGCRLSEVYH